MIVSEPDSLRIIVSTSAAMARWDVLLVTCETATDDTALHDKAHTQLSTRMKAKYGLTAEIAIAAPGSLPRSEGKAKRVFDHRKDKP
ncbi:MAG: hypothetical protein WDM89_06640 [Rhizomicrobium sp.]